MKFSNNRGDSSFKRFQKPIPVKEGDTYDVTIESIGEKGDGIAKVEGYVIVVPDTKKGEKVKVKVNAVRGKVSFGEVVERLGEASPKDEEETGDEEETASEDGEETEEEEEDEEEMEEESEDEETEEGETEEEEMKEEEEEK